MLKSLLMKKERTGFPLIAAFGDRVTQRCFELGTAGQRPANDYHAVYHEQLRRRLNHLFPDRPVNILNAGVGGNGVWQGAERLQADVLDYHPELVIGCFGLNDAPNGEEYLKTYRAGVSSILSRIQRAGAVPVFMTPNMLNTRVIAEDIPPEYRGLAEKTARIQNDGIMDAYMDAAREECTRLGVTVCDVMLMRAGKSCSRRGWIPLRCSATASTILIGRCMRFLPTVCWRGCCTPTKGRRGCCQKTPVYSAAR